MGDEHQRALHAGPEQRGILEQRRLNDLKRGTVNLTQRAEDIFKHAFSLCMECMECMEFSARQNARAKAWKNRHMKLRLCLALFSVSAGCFIAKPAYAAGPPARTTLSDPSIHYVVPEKAYVVLREGPLEAVVADNRAVDDAILPGHRAGYHGIASLKHARQPRNLFVPNVAGVNFEHIHDGSAQDRKVLFEPRNAPIQLRQIDAQTAELYQPPTPFWGLESCQRYRLMTDGSIEFIFECIPRRDTYQNGYIGLFWACYIDQPESLDTHFLGCSAAGSSPPDWVRGVTPSHGVLATRPALDDHRQFPHDPAFPLSLVFNLSNYRYTEPFYFGVCRGMVFTEIFRRADQVRFSQSPSGAGEGKPAWDFQWFIPRYKINERYQLVARFLYFPAPEGASMSETGERVRRAVSQLKFP